MTLHQLPAQLLPAPFRSGRRSPAWRIALTVAVAATATVGLTHPAAARPGGTHGPATDNSAPGARYVALGDSYSSGLGIPDEVDLNCGRSNHNYASLVARAVHAETFTDVTCAGAETRHLTERQESAPPQLDALRPNTSLVTLGIGGNDLGLSGIVTRCVLLAQVDANGAPCKTSYTLLGQDEIRRRINTIAPRIDALLKDIHARSPQAEVLLVGYPAIVPDDGSACRDLIPFATGDFPWFRDKAKQLNSMLAQQANVYDATYIDAYGPSAGHDACKPAGERWVEPEATDSAAGFHPNAAGHASVARSVLTALGR
ncbi:MULTISPECIES: SGNH/GDSL hydrolase family protein [unclassified Streptomyces]|uniref:SGNH/GDSL hydrolase family protein n=1 Tax=unclassified Streptomyces TaxID=2593676 RepID=UPI002E19AA73|nr:MULTISPECIES: SGNH/GDSL hydrolase family protein [unclassified Streptomyces]